jgi:hypothetical protein
MTRPTAVGFLAGLVLVASCSGAPAQTTTTTSTEPAPIIGIFQPFDTTWAPADDFEQAAALARSALVSLGGSILVPVSLPPRTSKSAGRLVIYQTFPTNQVHVDVNITFTQDQREMALSLSSYPADVGYPTCAERLMGMGGWEVGEAAEVRSSPGCMSTNTVGLSFIEWDDGTRWYHVETYMDPRDVIPWLADWRLLP